MKVLHLVSSPTLTGPADPALGLARAQRSLLGIDARLACDRVREGNLLAKAEAAGVPVVDGPKLCTKSGPFTALADRSVLKALAAEHDVIHAHTSHDHALAATARGRAALVRTLHHVRSAHRRGLQGFAYARTDGFVAVAEAHVSTLLAAYPRIDPARVTVVRGAVDTERFRPGLDGRALRARHGLPEDAFVFAIVARIKPGRQHDLLLRAFAAARAKAARDLRLVLIGKGEGEPAVRALAGDLGLAQHVCFYGFRDDDLPEAISSANATVLLAEGNDAGCRAVLESLACGVPVIGADHPAIREALDGAGCGDLFPAGDEQALEDALLRAAALDPAARTRAAAAARERVSSRYSERARAEAVAAFYDRLRALGRPR